MSFTNDYFKLGYQLQKQAGQGWATAVGALGPGLLPAMGAALAAEEGKKMRTAVGQTVGGFGGGLLGAGLGVGVNALSNALNLGHINPEQAALLGALPGLMAGGGIGAYLAHGPNRTK